MDDRRLFVPGSSKPIQANMRVTCLIENLGSGGAERQMVQLATLLRKRGFDVNVLVYHHGDHYRRSLDRENIPIQRVCAKRGVRRACAIRRFLRNDSPDVVIAFKVAPSVYAELSGIPSRNFGLIVSERNHDFRGATIRARTRFALHALADAVVCNSQSQLDLIQRAAPWLKQRTHRILNCVDLGLFRPARRGPHRPACLKLLVLARFAPQKNALRLVEALARLRSIRQDFSIVVNWFGSNRQAEPAAKAYSDQVEAFVTKYRLQNCFHIHDACADVIPLLQQCDALCLPSIYEGLPNAICEGMACGLPILASRVSDNPALVHDGENGFLFDPFDPESIADALLRFADLPLGEVDRMAKTSRGLAERLFSPERFADQYENLLHAVRKSRPTRSQCLQDRAA
jgi:glycosyltransferase involved in cell wall biosynthesis